jgi:ribonuclease H2 subunit B
VVDAAPLSPPPEDEEEKPKPTAYYRPSREAILAILRGKVDRLAEEGNFAKFDHLVRGLGREGLLEAGADPALVQG